MAPAQRLHSHTVCSGVFYGTDASDWEVRVSLTWDQNNIAIWRTFLGLQICRSKLRSFLWGATNIRDLSRGALWSGQCDYLCNIKGWLISCNIELLPLLWIDSAFSESGLARRDDGELSRCAGLGSSSCSFAMQLHVPLHKARCVPFSIACGATPTNIFFSWPGSPSTMVLCLCGYLSGDQITVWR